MLHVFFTKFYGILLYLFYLTHVKGRGFSLTYYNTKKQLLQRTKDDYLIYKELESVLKKWIKLIGKMISSIIFVL